MLISYYFGNNKYFERRFNQYKQIGDQDLVVTINYNCYCIALVTSSEDIIICKASRSLVIDRLAEMSYHNVQLRCSIDNIQVKKVASENFPKIIGIYIEAKKVYKCGNKRAAGDCNDYVHNNNDDNSNDDNNDDNDDDDDDDIECKENQPLLPGKKYIKRASDKNMRYIVVYSENRNK
uniref:Uncharacterized protein n=1 Tax=Glossina morsitans morsitans TaxID=37546 RepID=A0A1B0FHI9_GLOMM